MTTNETLFFRDKKPSMEGGGPPGAGAGACRRTATEDLVCGLLHGAGAVFDRDVPEGGGRRWGGGPRSSRPTIGGRAREIQGRHVQPVRSPARPAYPDADEVLHAEWRTMAAQGGYPRHGTAPAVEPDAGLSHLGTFDIIFCRNVLIYFDQDTKANIFGRIARMLEPDGVLALGAAESVVGITNAFKPYPDRRGLYRPNAAPASCGRSDPMPQALKAVASAR